MELIHRLSPVDCVAHRLVRGGSSVTAPTVLTDRVRAALDEVVSPAPLHLPKSLSLLDFLRERMPGTTHVVCPDTAFCRDLPEAARTYALPELAAAAAGTIAG
ncbi:hypothetical protein [Amycolatopsis sp.]|uniref:hypothetical protein n=1 Tax=Amycolatopsis sp. TaxID=37632 RepID=UPI002BF6F815|nr:hypothetical protein [Amycolatopsis sp.]HVV14560.1 hypothetical protein [Amycolatopsis sp.]